MEVKRRTWARVRAQYTRERALPLTLMRPSRNSRTNTHARIGEADWATSNWMFVFSRHGYLSYGPRRIVVSPLRCPSFYCVWFILYHISFVRLHWATMSSSSKEKTKKKNIIKQQQQQRQLRQTFVCHTVPNHILFRSSLLAFVEWRKKKMVTNKLTQTWHEQCVRLH